MLPRSVVLIAPTSTSAKPASFRPEIDVRGTSTRVLVEQVGAVDVSRLGGEVGRVSVEQQWAIDAALLTVVGLD
jgi:mRNA interferase MazF